MNNINLRVIYHGVFKQLAIEVPVKTITDNENRKNEKRKKKMNDWKHNLAIKRKTSGKQNSHSNNTDSFPNVCELVYTLDFLELTSDFQE